MAKCNHDTGAVGRVIESQTTTNGYVRRLKDLIGPPFKFVRNLSLHAYAQRNPRRHVRVPALFGDYVVTASEPFDKPMANGEVIDFAVVRLRSLYQT